MQSRNISLSKLVGVKKTFKELVLKEEGGFVKKKMFWSFWNFSNDRFLFFLKKTKT